MYTDRIISEEEQWKLIKEDKLSRNEILLSLVRMLNAEYGHDGAIIAMDGDWGSGKTYLIKQLECLWGREENPFTNDNDSAQLEEFRNKYITLYYNAWENDYAVDAAQSIMLCLLDCLRQNENIINKAERSFIGSIDITKLINNVSLGLIDIERGETGKDVSDLALDTNKRMMLRKNISELMNEILTGLDGNRKILFIVDDLDRCKPTYAVEVLEAIKYYFGDKRVMFLVATNVKELGNVVKGYYGGFIDGHAYLDRFFDMMISVGEISPEIYLKFKLREDLNMDAYAAVEVAGHLHLSMWEMNRYASILNLSSSYISSYYGPEANRDLSLTALCRVVFLPIFAGYKIKDRQVYEDLISGNGFNYIKDIMEKRPELKKRAFGFLPGGDMGINTLNIYYKKLFDNTHYPNDEVKKFWEAIKLVGRIIYP